MDTLPTIMRTITIGFFHMEIVKCYKRGFPKIREINARIIKMIIIHLAIVHAILPINPRLTNITAIMITVFQALRASP